MPKRYKDLKIKAVGLVDVGANQLAKITLIKRHQEGDMPEDLKKELDEKTAALAAAQKELAELKGTVSPPDIATARAEFETIKRELGKARDDLQKQYDETSKELDETRAEVLKLHAQRRREQWIHRVQKDLKDLPGASADDFAEIMDHIELNTLEKPKFEKLCRLLASWNTVVSKSKLFEEVGSATIGGFTGAEGKLHALAKELQSQSTDPKLTFEQAYSRVLVQHPDLYKQYQAERAERGK